MYEYATIDHAPMAPAGAGRARAVRTMNVLYVSFTK